MNELGNIRIRSRRCCWLQFYHLAWYSGRNYVRQVLEPSNQQLLIIRIYPRSSASTPRSPSIFAALACFPRAESCPRFCPRATYRHPNNPPFDFSNFGRSISGNSCRLAKAPSNRSPFMRRASSALSKNSSPPLPLLRAGSKPYPLHWIKIRGFTFDQAFRDPA